MRRIGGAKVKKGHRDKICPDQGRELIDMGFVIIISMEGDRHDQITVLPEMRNLTWRYDQLDSLCL